MAPNLQYVFTSVQLPTSFIQIRFSCNQNIRETLTQYKKRLVSLAKNLQWDEINSGAVFSYTFNKGWCWSWKKKSNIKFRGKKISFFLHCYRSAHKMENLFMLQLIAMALVLRASTSTAYPNSIGDYSGSSMCILILLI